MTGTIDLRRPHRTRPIRFVDLHQLRGWSLKVYTIHAGRHPPSSELVAGALARAGQVLPTDAQGPGSGDEHHGVGFVVIHRAADYAFVLIDWWSGQNELRQHLLSAPLDRPGELAPHPSPAIGCVWELAVVDFERRAWLRHVLDNPNGPDLEAYLDDRDHEDV